MITLYYTIDNYKLHSKLGSSSYAPTEARAGKGDGVGESPHSVRRQRRSAIDDRAAQRRSFSQGIGSQRDFSATSFIIAHAVVIVFFMSVLLQVIWVWRNQWVIRRDDSYCQLSQRQTIM